jgi:hypothetical protein
MFRAQAAKWAIYRLSAKLQERPCSMCWTRRDDCNRHCDDMAKAFCNVTVTLAPFYLTLATLGWGTHDVTLSVKMLENMAAAIESLLGSKGAYRFDVGCTNGWHHACDDRGQQKTGDHDCKNAGIEDAGSVEDGANHCPGGDAPGQSEN